MTDVLYLRSRVPEAPVAQEDQQDQVSHNRGHQVSRASQGGLEGPSQTLL